MNLAESLEPPTGLELSGGSHIVSGGMRVFKYCLSAMVILGGMSVSSQDSPPRAPIIETLDLAVTRPPDLVPIDGKLVIVFEAQLTNLLRSDVALDRISVSSASSGQNLAAYSGDALDAILGRPGLSRDADRRVLGPGVRAVANFWIELDALESRIGGVSLRVESTIRRTTGEVASAFESRLNSISRDAPVVLDPPVRGGPWTAIYDPLLVGGHRTAIYTVDGRARVPGRFAIDWIRYPGPNESADALRNGYGVEVLAVVDAVVVDTGDGLPDSFGASGPMSAENASGNFVTLDIGGGRFAFYEHLSKEVSRWEKDSGWRAETSSAGSEDRAARRWDRTCISMSPTGTRTSVPKGCRSFSAPSNDSALSGRSPTR